MTSTLRPTALLLAFLGLVLPASLAREAPAQEVPVLPVQEGSAPPAAAEEAAPAAEEVRFEGFGGLQLEGTLLLPAGEGRGFPAALLLPGSGPTDRDGNQPLLKTDLLAQIAERLAAEGIASLRFDKRAVARYARDWPGMVEEQDAFFRWEAFAGDVAAAHAFMRARSEVDPSRVAVLGHSEGGLLALQLANDLAADERPAALVLAATAGRKLDEVVREQIASLLELQRATEEQRARYMEALEAAMAAVIAREPLPELPPGLRPLFPANAISLLHAYFTIDPAELAASYPGPVLVLQGEKDAQVSAERDAPRLDGALRARDTGRTELVLVPDASHNLKRTEGPLDPGFVGPVLPEALDAIAGFLSRELAAR